MSIAPSDAFVQVDVLVRFNNGAYVTNTVNGVRASSTASAETAARTFAHKYFQHGFVITTAVPSLRNDPLASQRFRVQGQTHEEVRRDASDKHLVR